MQCCTGSLVQGNAVRFSVHANAVRFSYACKLLSRVSMHAIALGSLCMQAVRFSMHGNAGKVLYECNAVRSYACNAVRFSMHAML